MRWLSKRSAACAVSSGSRAAVVFALNRRRRGLLAVVFVAVASKAVLALVQTPTVAKAEPIAPVPQTVDIDPRRIALGERLFGDVRLSREGATACSTCHPLNRGGMDRLAVARRPDGTDHLRNTPTMFNVALNSSYNWDGAAYTLEKHTENLLASLMNIPWPELLARLQSDREYAAAFAATYPEGLTRASVLDAIASFERSLLTPDSRFDRYLRGATDALTAREEDGYRLFKANGCVSCHQGVNIGGNMYQRFGVFEAEDPRAYPVTDVGRLRITKVPRDERVFRVPSLRNVAITAPYFHDGRSPTLDDAVDTMARYQLGRTLDKGDTERIIAFLYTLTGAYRGRPLIAF